MFRIQNIGLWGIILLLIGLLTFISIALAQEPPPSPSPTPPDPELIDPLEFPSKLPDTDLDNVERFYPDIAEQSELITSANLIVVIVQLDTLSASKAIDSSGVQLDNSHIATQAQITQTERLQTDVLDQLTANGIDYQIVATYSRVFSGMALQIDANQLHTIEAIPGVAAVFPAGIGNIENDTSLPFVGAPVVWNTGFTGIDVKVGVIDTGIDYTHAMFGGTGGSTVFPTIKVAGGYDFVGNSWDPVTNPIFQPDPDPLDQVVHGTHIAGTIAGLGVDSSGNTYTGPWDNTTPISSMSIGPGVAPEATLYALKVGGPSGFTSEAAAIAAFEWASDPNGDGDLSDRLDVINISLGTYYGEPDQGWSLAAQNATELGIIVVAPSGNPGDAYFSVDSPSSADGVISVAASWDDNGGTAADTMLEFSARGPQRSSDPGSIALKPDITAPGVDILSAYAGTGNGAFYGTGTSSSSAIVAGMMALLRERYPTWTVSELKALIMNTANYDLFQGNNLTPPNFGPTRVGSGRLNAPNSFTSEVIAYNAAQPDQVNVSFGVLNVPTPLTLQRDVAIENKSTSSVSYLVDYQPMVYADDAVGGTTPPGVGGGGPGVVTSVSPNSISLAPGETKTVTVSLAIIPSAMTRPFTHDPTIIERFPTPRYYRYWLAEEAGYVTFEPVIGPPMLPSLRVPVYAAPRPSSTMNAVNPVVLAPGTNGTVNINLTGIGVNTGSNYPYDETSLVSAFELHDTSSLQPTYVGNSAGSADLAYVGISSDYVARGSDLSRTRLFFGIATHNEWSSLSDDVQFEVYIDPNQDGIADYLLWHGSVLKTLLGAQPSDEFYVFLNNLNLAGNINYLETFVNFYAPIEAASMPNTVVFQTNVVFLPMYAADIAELVPGSTVFDYWVVGKYGDEVIDVSNVMTYNIETASIDLSSGTTSWRATLYDDQNGASVDVTYDWTQYAGPNPPCILLLHHHNIPGMRAENVCLETDLRSDLSIEKSVSNNRPDQSEPFEYTIIARNDDSVVITLVVVTDRLPANLTYLSHQASQGTYTPFNGQWDIGTLQPGATATLIISAEVPLGVEELIINTATIHAGAAIDRTPGNNEASAVIDSREPTISIFDPALSKVGELQPGGLGLPGESLVWTITLTNTGDVPGHNFQVVDAIVPEMRIERVTTGRGTYTIEGQIVTITINTLAPGETVQMQIYTTVIGTPTDGILRNTATVLDANATALVSATAEMNSAISLPATGYSPASETRYFWIRTLMISLIVFVSSGLGGIVLRHRWNHRYSEIPS